MVFTATWALGVALGVLPGNGPATPQAPPSNASAVPAPLQCLVRFHGVQAEAGASGGWTVVLPNGTRLPWEGPRGRSDAEREARPFPLDMFLQDYVRGPLVPVTDPRVDPGRVRSEPLWDAVYGATEAEVRARLVPVQLAGHRVWFHARAAAALSRVDARVVPLLRTDAQVRAVFRTLGGTFNHRVIAGTARKSAHAWGVAVDLEPSLGDYWRWSRTGWRNRIPASVVQAFEDEGFIWGGRWFHFDTMHFEYRPELLDPACR